MSRKIRSRKNSVRADVIWRLLDQTTNRPFPLANYKICQRFLCVAQGGGGKINRMSSGGAAKVHPNPHRVRRIAARGQVTLVRHTDIPKTALNTYGDVVTRTRLPECFSIVAH